MGLVSSRIRFRTILSDDTASEFHVFLHSSSKPRFLFHLYMFFFLLRKLCFDEEKRIAKMLCLHRRFVLA